MSDFLNPAQSPEDYEFYAFIVDNEVAVVMPVSSVMPLHNAVFSSDPIIKKLSSEQKNTVVQGWTWNGNEFVAPQ